MSLWKIYLLTEKFFFFSFIYQGREGKEDLYGLWSTKAKRK